MWVSTGPLQNFVMQRWVRPSFNGHMLIRKNFIYIKHFNFGSVFFFGNFFPLLDESRFFFFVFQRWIYSVLTSLCQSCFQYIQYSQTSVINFQFIYTATHINLLLLFIKIISGFDVFENINVESKITNDEKHRCLLVKNTKTYI